MARERRCQADIDFVDHITGMAAAAKGTTEGASYTNQAAAELARLATTLQGLVRQFDCGRDNGQVSRSAASSQTPLDSDHWIASSRVQ